MIRVKTPRLELVAGTLDLAECEIRDPNRLTERLDATLPCPWPPPLNDEHSMAFNFRYLQKHPDAEGFSTWYFIAVNPESGARLLIGNGGCKGMPRDGVVEIGYSLFPDFQGRGYATEAVGGLLGWIFSHDEVHTVIAETLPELVGSIRVLEKGGFTLIGEGSEPGVIRFALPRNAYEERRLGDTSQ